MNTEQRTADDIRAFVADYLKAKGVTFSAVYLGERTRDGWKCDAWRVDFTSDSRPLEPEEFDYFTGTGLRKATPNQPAPRPAYRPGTIAHEDWKKTFLPVAPHPADVLCSLAMDSSAASQTFADWCSDFGYDTDSRKALATYEACQQNADKLTRIFGRGAIEEIQQMTQDY